MRGGIQILNMLILGVGLSLSCLGLTMTWLSQQLKEETKRFFITFFCLLTAYVLSCMTEQMTVGQRAYLHFSQVALFLESTFSSMLMLLLPGYILSSAGERRWQYSEAFRAALILWLIYFALLVYTQFSRTIYWYDENNVYHRGPFYPILLVPPVATMLVNAVAFWNVRKKLTPRQQFAIASYLVLPVAAMLIQMAFYGLLTVVLGTTIAMIVMFITILLEQTDQYVRQENENTQLRVDVMLTQIQPHFLYNTLGAIQSLCRTEPETAEKAVAKFARYLRGNMDSLSQVKAIPFTKELEHTRLYLELEQLRYEDALQVRYELETTNFKIPTLTLQPLAENAVRHGVRGKPDGRGFVTIATRELPDCWEVSVIDDGPGFDPAELPLDGRSHIGLANVRERLQRVTGGYLEIESAPGQGTCATIVLPKGE